LWETNGYQLSVKGKQAVEKLIFHTKDRFLPAQERIGYRFYTLHIIDDEILYSSHILKIFIEKL